MPPLKPHKIDLQAEYPCPCGRRGQILPISLTDALGCNRCHHIFTVTEKGYQLEQISTAYTAKKAWYWSGSQWKLRQSRWSSQVFSWVLYTLVGLLLIGALLAYWTWVPIRFLWIAGFVGAFLLVLIRIVFYRR